jgi:hypothetical protein
MVQLKKYSSLPEGASVALLVDKKTKLPAFADVELKALVKSFLKSEDNFDYFKTAKGNLYLIKADQQSEKLRQAGNKVFAHASKQSDLYVQGDTDSCFLSSGRGF